MGFGNLIGQVVVFTIFLLVVTTTINMYANQTKDANEAITYKNKKILDVANTDIAFKNISYANGNLSMRMQNEGGTTINSKHLDVYVDSTKITRTTLTPLWRSCDPMTSDSRCGEIGYGDYSWETTNLIGLWRLNEERWTADSANSVIDYSGSGYHGTPKDNANTTNSSVFNKAGAFDGDTDYVTTTGDITSGLNTATFSAWAKHTESKKQVIMTTYSETNENGARIYLSASDTVIFEVQNRTGTTVTADSTAVSLNQWHHYAGVYDGSNVLLYVDGSLQVDQPALVGEIASCEATMTIGAGFTGTCALPTYGGTAFNGIIDEVAIWDRALSADEILSLYRKGKETFNPGLWDPSEYMEADIEIVLEPGLHKIETITGNSFKAVTTVTI
jgi:archaellum component FlaF (FlaF/FlaG flagellin family)